MKTRIVSSAAVVVLLLAGCGGGDDAPPAPVAADPTAEVPGTASQSSAGMVGYLNALSAAEADAKEPLNLDGFTPPTSDDTEPDTVS